MLLDGTPISVRAFAQALFLTSSVGCVAMFGSPTVPAANAVQEVAALTGNGPVLLTVAAVRKLSITDIESGLPVRLGGVVTFYDPRTDLLFVQDRTGGIFIKSAHGTNSGLRVGQTVEVEGITRAGAFAPVIAEATVRVEGKGHLPGARPVTAERLFDGTEDGNWVEAHGIVTSLTTSDSHRWLDLEVAVLGDTFKAHIPNFSKTNGLPNWLVDSRIALRGVVGTFFNQRRQALSFQLFVPSLEFVRVERAAPADPFSLTARPINGLLQWNTNTPPGHRVKVQGIVTLKGPDRQIYLQDGTGGIGVDLIKPFTLEPGATIEVVGFPRGGFYSARLRQAIWRPGGDARRITPVNATVKEMRRGNLDGILVQLDGLLTGHTEHDRAQVLTLQEGQLSFEAHLHTNHVSASLQPGSRLRVTGVCEMKMTEGQRPSDFRLLLRSPDDVVVLAQPPWWTVSRLLTVLVVVTMAAALWLLINSRCLAALQRRNSELFENATDLVYALDLQGRFTALNKATEQITGYGKLEALNRSFDDWVAPEHRAAFRTWWKSLVEGAEPPPQEFNILARDGHRVILEISGRLLRARGKPVAVEAIARDITLRRQAEDQRLLLERKLLDAQKLESLGVMAGGVAHDFNNLLTTILGNAVLAEQSLTEDTPGRAYLKTIEKISRQAAELCKQLLAYSGKGRFVIQCLHLNTLIEHTRELLQASVSKKATLEMDLPEDVGAIECDPSQIRQVLMNLVINGSEALADHPGLIRIRTGIEHVDGTRPDDVTFGAEALAGDYVFLEVADTGCGMDRETLSKVLEPFFTTKFIGRGLGLAAVSGIVRAHRGALRITSEPGRGSTFRVLFPRCDAPAEPAKAEPAKAAPWRGRGTVLVADDESGVRAVTCQMLQRFGFDVLPAADGEETIKKFCQHAPQLVAVVLDLTMPRLSGEEALQAIRQIRKDMPVLLTSGFSESKAMEHFRGDAAVAFLAKPFNPEELGAKIQALLAPTREDDENVAPFGLLRLNPALT